MKIEYDKEGDALYIRIQEKDVARTQEVSLNGTLHPISSIFPPRT
jgi:uncharacterized protein YuzE